MIENVNHLTAKAKIEIVKKQKQKSENLLGKYKSKINGGKIFRFDIESSRIGEVKYQDQTVNLGQLGNDKKKLIVMPGSVYIEALNIKNAIKRLQKGKIIFATAKKNNDEIQS